MRGPVIEAFARSIDTVFLAAVPIALVGFAITLLLREVPLRTGAAPTPVDGHRGGVDQQAGSNPR